MQDRTTPHPDERAAPLTREEVIRVVGDVSDDTLAEIMATGCTVDELQEAVALAQGETDVLGKQHPRPPADVYRLYEILVADEEWPPEPDGT